VGVSLLPSVHLQIELNVGRSSISPLFPFLPAQFALTLGASFLQTERYGSKWESLPRTTQTSQRRVETVRFAPSSPIESPSLLSFSLTHPRHFPFLPSLHPLFTTQILSQRKALQLLRLRLRILLHHSLHSNPTSLVSLSTRLVRRHRHQQ